MKRIDLNYQDYIGQGENSDLLVSVVEFDRKFDSYFNIEYQKVEQAITNTDESTYQGIEDSALSTSYLDYFQMYTDISQGESLVDLGAGYCRGTLLFNALGDKRCISVEREALRSRAAVLKCENDILIADLLDENFRIPLAENYFIYLPVDKVLYSIFKKIIGQKIEANFYVIESHGDLIDFFQFHKELFVEQEFNIKTSLPRHRPFIYKFKSKIVSNEKISNLTIDNLSLWHLYNNDKDIDLKISSTIPGSKLTREWRSSIKGSHLIRYNNRLCLSLENPSRIIDFGNGDQILSIIKKD